LLRPLHLPVDQGHVGSAQFTFITAVIETDKFIQSSGKPVF